MLVFVLTMLITAAAIILLVHFFRDKIELINRKFEIIIYALFTLAAYVIYYVFTTLIGLLDAEWVKSCSALISAVLLIGTIYLFNALYRWQESKGGSYGPKTNQKRFINGFLMLGLAIVFVLADMIKYKGFFVEFSSVLFSIFLGFFVSIEFLMGKIKEEAEKEVGKEKCTVKMLCEKMTLYKKETLVCICILVGCFLMIFFSDIITYAINGAIVGAILGFVIALLIHVFKKRPEKKLKPGKKRTNKKKSISGKMRKGVKMVITAISFIGAIFFKSTIDFSDLKNTYFDYAVAKDLMADICIGIFSAMILVWLIDEAKDKAEIKEEDKRHIILYRKLSPLLNNYYEFFLNLYITTRKEPVPANSKVLDSIIACKEEFIKQLEEAEPFYKSGFYGDPRKFEWQMQALQSANEEETKRIFETDTNLPLYHCWTIDSGKFVDGVEEIEIKFLEFFPSDLLDMVDNLLDMARVVKRTREWIDGVGDFQWILGQLHQGPIILPVEFFINEAKIMDTLEALEKVIEYIEAETGETIRRRELDFFNNRNCKPILGDSYKK